MSPTLIEQFIEYLLATRGLSGRTAQAYSAALTDLRAYALAQDETLTWQTLDTDIVRSWMAHHMAKGSQPRTVRPMLAGVRTFYRYLLQQGLVQFDPVHTLAPPKADKPLPTFLKRSEVDALLNELTFPPSFEGVRDQTIIATLCHTGIRASEILGLKSADIDISEGQLRVTGKRNKQRIIPFSPRLGEQFRAYLAARQEYLEEHGLQSPLEEDVFFIGPRLRKMSYSLLRKIVKTALSCVTTQKKRSPHVLRHTFATLMLDNGGDLEAIQQLLGHESVGTTEIYTHTSFAELRAQYAQAHPHAQTED